MYNFNDLDAIVHMLGWNDFVLDYQVEEPMESNHYVENRSPFIIIFIIIGAFVFVVCKKFKFNI